MKMSTLTRWILNYVFVFLFGCTVHLICEILNPINDQPLLKRLVFHWPFYPGLAVLLIASGTYGWRRKKRIAREHNGKEVAS